MHYLGQNVHRRFVLGGERGLSCLKLVFSFVYKRSLFCCFARPALHKQLAVATSDYNSASSELLTALSPRIVVGQATRNSK